MDHNQYQPLEKKIKQDGHGWTLWIKNHPSMWQFVLFMLMSGITTIVDFSSYVIFNFVVFKELSDVSFKWWIINYTVETGGLGAFYSFALSFLISQTFNFFLQRKTTFKANNNVLKSSLMYAVMVIFVYFLQLYLPSLIQKELIVLLGVTFGSMSMKVINMTVSMLIQFPLNKYVIMKNQRFNAY